jgi:fatty-acyl-CoA synthase
LAASEATALVEAGLSFDYRRLIARSQRAAARLHHDWGIQRGDRVAYLGANSSTLFKLLFACAEIGAIYVPLNWRLAPAELARICADCAPALILHDSAHEAVARELGKAKPLTVLLQMPSPKLSMPAPGSAADPALIVYTSGTTGAPRGALHTQAMLLANVRAAIAAQSLNAEDRVLAVLPMFHVGGLCIQSLPALFAGASVEVHAAFDAGAWLAAVRERKPTQALMVPATMKAVIAHADWAATSLDSLRALWAGSSLLPEEAVVAFAERGLSVCSVYGSTETGPLSLVQLPEKSHKRGCTGTPALGVEARISNPNAEGVGELWLRAPNIITRYWPALAARNADGFFQTGDLARQDADGDFFIAGRIKELIISGGENIYAAEVEAALLAHPAVAEAAVIGVPDARWGEVPAAVLVLHAKASAESVNRAVMEEFLGARLARYKQPKVFEIVQQLPKTALGKVKKHELSALFTARS